MIITQIEKHFFENKDKTVYVEYWIYKGCVYDIKSKSQLTKTEKDWLNKNKLLKIFHF